MFRPETTHHGIYTFAMLRAHSGVSIRKGIRLTLQMCKVCVAWLPVEMFFGIEL